MANSFGMTAHFEQDFGALVVREFSRLGRPGVVFGVEGDVGSELLSKFKTARADVGDENFSGTGGVSNGDRHEANRADTGDQNAATADAGGHDGVHRVAERIENSGDVVGNVRVDGPDVFLGNGDKFGEAAVGIDAENIDLLADMAVPRAAGLAHATADVAFGTDSLADGRAGDGRANGVNTTNEFVAGGDADFHAAAAPGIPFINMTVGPTDAGVRHGNQHVARANFRHGRVVLEPKAGFVLEFADGKHGRSKKCEVRNAELSQR